MDEEMLYDDVAMENAYGYMNTANGKLAEASGEYSSGELSGINLNDVRDFISKAASLIGKFVSAADNIYEGGDLNFNFSENQGTNGSQGTNINTSEVQSEINLDELTEEQIDEYEAEIQSNLDMCDEMARFYENQANELNGILSNFLCTFVGVYAFASDIRSLTPEEYEQWLIERIAINPYNEDGSDNLEYLAELEKIKGIVAEYREVFEAEFEKTTGRNYSEFIEELNNSSAIAASARSSKYSLEQQLKEIPYLRMMLTDEYKEFASGEYDLSKVQEILPNHFYYDEETQTMKSFLNEQEQMMVLYLWETQGEDAGWDSIIKYLNAKEDKLNQIRAAKEVEDFLKENMNENGELTLGAFNEFMGEGFVDGMWTFADGIVDIFRTDGMMSYTQYKQMYLLAALQEQGNLTSDFLGGVYQNFSTIGNMIIPMMMSGGLGAVGSSILMGASAGGNAKNQALIDGYGAPNAWIYGLCSGMSESVLSYFLGSIPGLSQSSGFTIGNILSEGFEEFSQEWFDAGLRALVFGEEIDFDTLGVDSLKSFAMGMLIAGQLNGAKTIAVKIKGKILDIPFSKIKEMCQNNPGMTAAEAIAEIIVGTKLDEYRAMQTNSFSTFGMSQAILSFIFEEGNCFTLNQESKDIAIDIMERYSDEIISFLTNSFFKMTDEVAKDTVNSWYDKFRSSDTITFESVEFGTILIAFSKLESKFGISIRNEFENGAAAGLNESNKDVNDIRKLIIDYFKEKGMKEEDTIIAFRNYENISGGICTYATLANSICNQLSEEVFYSHFGFEKYVTLDGQKIYNPLLLADMVFEMNREGNIKTPNFIFEDGNYHLNTKNFEIRNTLGTPEQTIKLELINQYMNSKGLNAVELAKQGAYKSEVDAKTSGVPESGVEISADYLKFIVDTAIEQGAEVQFNIFGGKLIERDTGYENDYTGVGHAINIIGTCEEGFIVATRGKEYIFPYEDVKFVEVEDLNGNKEQLSTIAYSILQITEETKGEYRRK